jgi:hypothetical protein
MVDKYEAKRYVQERIGEEHIIPTLGIYDKFDDIDFDALPNKFVMKCSHACAFNYICFDKTKLDKKALKKKFDKWLKIDYGKKTVERHYSPNKKCIIIEEMLIENDYLPIEYKIHCFNGKAKSLYVVTNRDRGIKYNNYYIDWTPFEESQFNHWTSDPNGIKKPDNFSEMVKIAEKISAKFPFVRVDLYNINGKIYFGENTFTPAKGTLTLKKDSADFEMGSWLDISSYINANSK